MIENNTKKISIDQINNPPVIEAIIEMSFPPPEEKVSIEKLSKIAKVFEKDFPVVKKLLSKPVPQVEAHTGGNERRQVGFNLRTSEDKTFKNIWLLFDKLLVGNVGQYCGGTELIKAFQCSWEAYTKELRYSKCSRLAMRYINRVEIRPQDIMDKIEALPLLPQLERSVYLNEIMSSFSIADDKLENKANINYFFKSLGDNKEKPETLEIFVDIDAYQENVDIQKWEVVLSKLEEIRAFKNDIFMGSFTQVGLRDFIK